MERDYGSRDADTHQVDGNAAFEQRGSTHADASPFIPPDKARKLLDEILAERAEVFRKLAQ